jgi:pilus assembly protein CpaE
VISGVKALVALESGLDRDIVEAVIPAEESLELVGLVESLDVGWSELGRRQVDVLLLGVAEGGEETLSFVDGVARAYPDRPIVVLYGGEPNGFSPRALAAGAEDIVALPETNGEPPGPAERERVASEILSALEKAVARRRRGTVVADTSAGRIVTVLGPKGGAGKTLVSCNLAVTLAEAGERVLLVDLDLQFGDVALALGLPPGKTIYDLAASGGALDSDKLNAYLVPHESGARVLAAPARPDQAAGVRTDFLRSLFEVVRESEDWVIVDTPPGFTPEVIAAIDASTDVTMVGMLDSLSLKNTKLGLETLELMGVNPAIVRLVLNRADSRVGMSRDDVAAITGKAPDVLIPSHRDIPRSVNEARPIVRSQPRSDAARALGSLGKSYLGTDKRPRSRKPWRRA